MPKTTGPDKPQDGEPTTAGLDARKSKILRAIVSEHIQTAQPVGSGHLSGAGGLEVSPATIRNEMNLLEREGYLTHPHTSAGRIPTDRGYRFFVDSLAGQTRLAEPKVQQVRYFFENAKTELEQLLTETSRMLSALTDYAAVIVAPPPEVATVRSVQIVSLGTRLGSGEPFLVPALVVVVMSNGAIEKLSIEIGSDLTDLQVNTASSLVSQVLVGNSLPHAGHLTPAPISCEDPQVDSLCALVLTAMLGPVNDETNGVFVGGASRMANAFETVDTIRKVLSVLEQHYVVVDLLRDALERSSKVSIGTEHGSDTTFERLSTCSVVVAPYLVDGKPAGTIGVLGPTRMDYPQAMAAVSMVSEGLSERLSDH